MRPCPTCGAPNATDKATCYSCGHSLTAQPPMPGHVPPPAAQAYSPQQLYPPQQQFPPQQQYAPQPYAAPPNAQPPYPPQAYAQAPSPYPQQTYAQPPYPQGYAQQPAPGMYPQQMAAAPPQFNPSEAARAAQIKKEYRAITGRLLPAVVVTIISGAAIAYAFKGQQTILGIPTLFWCCLPVAGMMAFAVATCRCPGCKASLMMRNDVNETGQCPFCNAQLK